MKLRNHKKKQAKISKICYRSGLEEKVCNNLQERNIHFVYEKDVVVYFKPRKECRYTPDVTLDNGIVIEIKGYLKREDRQKHILIQQQFPNLDIRFLFGNAKNKIYKNSKTTYADWCNKNNFKFCEKQIPNDWI